MGTESGKEGGPILTLRARGLDGDSTGSLQSDRGGTGSNLKQPETVGRPRHILVLPDLMGVHGSRPGGPIPKEENTDRELKDLPV